MKTAENKSESNKHRLTDAEDATRVENGNEQQQQQLLLNFCKCCSSFYCHFRWHCRICVKICSAEFNIDTIHCCTDNGFVFSLGNENMTKTRTNELIYHRHHTLPPCSASHTHTCTIYNVLHSINFKVNA